MKIKYEIWKDGKKYVVARQNGKMISRRALKGSGFRNKTEALRIFKTNNTFYKNRVREKRTNVTENSYTQPIKFNSSNPTPWLSKPIRKPRGKCQYVVQGTFNGKNIYGRSFQMGVLPGICSTSRECKEDAWSNFLKFLSVAQNGQSFYDEDEGIKVMENNKVTNLREGWVFYS